MKKVLFIIVVAVTGLILTCVSGEDGKEQPMKKLTMEAFEARSKDISNALTTFQAQEAIQSLTQVVDQLMELASYKKPDVEQWPSVRKLQAGLWIRTIQAVAEKVDKDFDSDKVPEMNVAAPGSYPSGISPMSIKEPDLRNQYEQVIAENKKKREQYEFQYKLNKIKGDISKKAEKSLVAMFATSPVDVEELKKLLESYGVDKEFEAKVITKVKNLAGD